jgi:integrase
MKTPKGIRTRTLRDGSKRHDAIVWERGKQIMLGAFETIGEAIAVRHAYFHTRAQETGETAYDSGALTLRQMGHLYLDSLSETALRTDRSRWHARVETAEFADWPLTQLTEKAVRRWVDAMARTPVETGKSAGELPQRGTLQNSLNLLRDGLRWAVIADYIDTNVAEGVTISNSTTATVTSGAGEYDYLHVDEVQAILDSTALPQRARVAFTLLAFTGARPHDLYMLTWDRVDVKGATIRFRTHKKKRDYLAHLLPVALDALKEWSIKCGRPGTGLVFPGHKGSPHARGYDWGWQGSYGRDGAQLEGWREIIGIRRPLALYSLRHTCASQLLLGAELYTGGRAWSLAEISSHLGHADTKTVERYARSLGIASKRAVEESRAAIQTTKARANKRTTRGAT